MALTQTTKIVKTRAKRPSRGKNKGKEKEGDDLGAGNQDAADREAAVEGNMGNEAGDTELNATDGEVARMRGE
jgi:hypothetical protein